MTFDELLKALRNLKVTNEFDFYRTSEPHIVYSIEGGCFWSINHQSDELEKHKFDIHQIFANDWKLDR